MVFVGTGKSGLTVIGVFLAAAADHVEHERPRGRRKSYQRHLTPQLLHPRKSIRRNNTSVNDKEHSTTRRQKSTVANLGPANSFISCLNKVHPSSELEHPGVDDPHQRALGIGTLSPSQFLRLKIK